MARNTTSGSSCSVPNPILTSPDRLIVAYRHRQAYTGACMRRVSFFISESLEDGLQQLQERDGVPKAESIRRAIAQYLSEKGVSEAKKKRKRVSKK